MAAQRSRHGYGCGKPLERNDRSERATSPEYRIRGEHLRVRRHRRQQRLLYGGLHVRHGRQCRYLQCNRCHDRPLERPNGRALNAQIVAVMSNAIDPASITNSAIAVTPSSGSSIPGTVTLASDGVTLTFVPSTTLTASKVYTISVGGFADIEGNSVAPFTSTFTSATSSYGANSFKLSSTTPANKTTGVSVTSPVTFTMTSLIDAASVNTQTVEVEVCFDGTSCSESEYVAGSFSINGATVTFTPLTQYPANTVIGMYLQGLMDEAGNAVYSPKFGTFTTASTVDQTPPTVSITPTNGATNAGLNTQIVLTFSKSMNPLPSLPLRWRCSVAVPRSTSLMVCPFPRTAARSLSTQAETPGRRARSSPSN